MKQNEIKEVFTRRFDFYYNKLVADYINMKTAGYPEYDRRLMNFLNTYDDAVSNIGRNTVKRILHSVINLKDR